MTGGDEAHEDPRVVRSRESIIAATLDLIAQRGVHDTTVDAISERSGVAKTTIYRHWDSKPEVVLAAISSQLGPPPSPDTGSLRQDLYELVTGLGWALSESPLARMTPSIIDAAHRDPEFADLHRRHVQQRHGVVVAVLERGRDRGELPADVDLTGVPDLLAGPVFHRAFVGHGPIDAAFCQWVVETVLRGLTAD